MEKIKVLVMSDSRSLMEPFAKLVGTTTGVDIEVSLTDKHNAIGGFLEFHARWKANPDLYDILLLGYPITETTKVYVRELTAEGKTIGEGLNVVFKVPGREFSLLGHDSRRQGLLATLQRSGVVMGSKNRALIIGDKSPAAVAAWACSDLSVSEMHVLNHSGRGVYGMERVHGVTVPKGRYDLVINTVPATGSRIAAPVTRDVFGRDCLVVDLIYNPVLQTHLLELAEECGCQTVDGVVPAAMRAAYGLQQVTHKLPVDVDEFLKEAKSIAVFAFSKAMAGAAH